MIWLVASVSLGVGYLLGRARVGHRLSDWAAWQSIGKKPTGWRYAATWTVLSAENIGWLITPPVRGWHAWKHRNDPPPPLAPAPAVRRLSEPERPAP